MSLWFPLSVTRHASFPYSDGKLKEADQILSINGQPLDQTVTHQQAIGILQSASERVQLTVARGPIPQLASPAVSRTPSAASTLSANSSAVQLHSHINDMDENVPISCHSKLSLYYTAPPALFSQIFLNSLKLMAG